MHSVALLENMCHPLCLVGKEAKKEEKISSVSTTHKMNIRVQNFFMHNPSITDVFDVSFYHIILRCYFGSSRLENDILTLHLLISKISKFSFLKFYKLSLRIGFSERANQDQKKKKSFI